MSIFKFKKQNRGRRRSDHVQSRRSRKAVVLQKKGRAVLNVFFRALFGSRVFKVVLIITLLLGSIIGLRYFLFSKKFNINYIEVSGNELISNEFFSQKLNYLYGQNIFFTRSSVLQKDIGRISPYIKNVEIEKELPDTLIVQIEERKPLFMWINLSGAYLVDAEGVVLEVATVFSNFDISQEDIEILKGYGNFEELELPNGDENDGLVDEISDKELNETEGGGNEQDSEDLVQEEKLQLFENEQNEIASRVEKFWTENLKSVQEKYSVYPYVFSYEQQNILVMNSLDSKVSENTRNTLSIDFFDQEVVKYVWESSYRFVIHFERARKVIFSTRREFSDQIEDLEILFDDFKKKGYEFKMIDLSSDAIVYELET